MKRILSLLLSSACALPLLAQEPSSSIVVSVQDREQRPLAHASVELLRRQDSALIKIQVTDSMGSTRFQALAPADYFFRITRVGYQPRLTDHFFIPDHQVIHYPAVQLVATEKQLSGVTITSRRPFVEVRPDKTLINLESGITTIGTSVLEALEKMPGVTIDKDGNVSLRGRAGVQVLIDGKPTYLSGAELSNLLAGMSAASVSQVELMTQPSARYDAAGNAGIINIITKKRPQKGFNGSLSASYAQGRYPKANEGLQLNYRNGKWSAWTNYALNANRSFTRLYALRRYFEADGHTVRLQLEQPSMLRGRGLSHTLRAGVDYAANEHTTIGINMSGFSLQRRGSGTAWAEWMDGNGHQDSLIRTESRNASGWRNGGLNAHVRKTLRPGRELSSDADLIGYRIRGDQFFENTGLMPVTYSEASRADLPSDIRIFSVRADYSEQLKKGRVEGGWKSALVKTDNLAFYELRNGGQWQEDLGKSNHFLYNERIHALYASSEFTLRNWILQGGLRYELTNYDARQLGNAIQKDSAFSRSYNSLFPTAMLRFAADSSHAFTLSAGRRIDRPAFQKLNPFLFVINKYTYQRGNPFYRPQYTWNFEFSHTYKDRIVTTLSYSTTRDYFSQVFPLDSNGIVIYTEGNLGRLNNLGASLSLQLNPAPWWSLNSQVVVNYKTMRGVIGRLWKAEVVQLNLNMSQTFRFGKGWSGELSGFYTSRSQFDIQEVLDPAGQVSVGLAKTLLKNQVTARLAGRDLFYTQWMKGLTQFGGADERFRLSRDTRVISLGLTYRFGKNAKTTRRSEGAASDEVQRVGNG